MSLLWAPVTLAAAAAQTARNAIQARLTAEIGVLGATQARFVWGLPFGAAFLALTLVVAGESAPAPGREALGWLAIGALAQIGATAAMLAAMRGGRFAATTALMKTEPMLVALAAFALIGDPLSASKLAAIALAALGAALVGWSGGGAAAGPALLGVLAGAGFGLAAVGFRGAITAFDSGGAMTRAATALVWSLAIQSLALGAWMAAFDRRALIGSVVRWRGALAAGFLGALASQLWFLGFALTAAANVRTLALVEVLMARAAAGRLFGEAVAPREILGSALIVAGAAWLVALSV